MISKSVQLVKKDSQPFGWLSFLSASAELVLSFRVMRPTSVARWGSDPTAAGGGRREGSEWPGSAGDEGAPSPRISAGHPNRDRIHDMQKTSAAGGERREASAVQRSVSDAAALSARRAPGTANRAAPI